MNIFRSADKLNAKKKEKSIYDDCQFHAEGKKILPFVDAPQLCSQPSVDELNNLTFILCRNENGYVDGMRREKKNWIELELCLHRFN